MIQLEQLKHRLKDQLEPSPDYTHDEDDISWNYQEGIVISRNEARLILAEPESRDNVPTVIIIGEPKDKEVILERLKHVRVEFEMVENINDLPKPPTKEEEFIIKPLPPETYYVITKEQKPSHKRPYKYHR